MNWYQLWGNNCELLILSRRVFEDEYELAIASLWYLDDASSVVFAKAFYQNLGKPNVRRAEALRLAQQALLKNDDYDHPRLWAPYVLVGSLL